MVKSNRRSLKKADKHDQTPFSYAASSISEGVVKILLRREEVNANQQDNNGQRLFLLAVPRKHERVGQVLPGRGRARLAKVKNNSVFLLGILITKEEKYYSE